jgi:hypothetical protein
MNEEVKHISELKSTTLDSYITKVATGPSRGKTQSGLLKSIKAIGGVTTALRKKAENNMKEDAPFDPVAHQKEADRLKAKHAEAHKALVAAPRGEESNKAMDHLNSVKREIGSHDLKKPRIASKKDGGPGDYYASKKPGEYTGD